MKKQVVSILFVASLTLGMVGCRQNPEEERKAVSASTTGSAVSGQAVSESGVQEEKAKKHVSTEVERQGYDNEIEEPVAINEIDWAAYENKMTAEEYVILQDYMSVLAENETFIWLKEDWEEKKEEYSYKKKKVTLQQFLEKQYKEAGIDESPSMLVNSIAFCDVFQRGKKDLILHIENMG